MTRRDPILGSLLGTAVGDALGLPTEGMSRRRTRRLHGEALRHRFLFRTGMLSDDTEHTLMVAKALLRHPRDVEDFQRRLAWSFRWWLLTLPAGVGLGTAKAILRLWCGIPSSRSGVRSAGNGPAMRSAIMGAVFRDDAAGRAEWTRASCRLTHTDPRALEAALLTAEAAALASGQAETREALNGLRPLVESEEMSKRFAELETCLGDHRSVEEYADSIGCRNGVSGFAPNTVAVALFAWLRHRGDFSRALTETIRCGGDTDTVAAVVGGICGAEVGEVGIPLEWVEGIRDWPRSIRYIRAMATALAEGSDRPPRFAAWAIPARNALFLAVVLGHGFRRLLPPYGWFARPSPENR